MPCAMNKHRDAHRKYLFSKYFLPTQETWAYSIQLGYFLILVTLHLDLAYIALQ